MTTTYKNIQSQHPKPQWFNITFNQIEEDGKYTELGDQLIFNTLDNRDITEQDYVSFFTIVQEGEGFCSHECIGIQSYYYSFDSLFHESRTVLPHIRDNLYKKKIGIVDVSLTFEYSSRGTVANLTHQWPKGEPQVRRFLQAAPARKI